MPQSIESDRAFRHPRIVDAEKAGDRTQRRRFAGAVGAQQRDDLPVGNRKRDALHVAVIVRL